MRVKILCKNRNNLVATIIRLANNLFFCSLFGVDFCLMR